MQKPDKKKILCVFGTRPEAIKMAPVIDQLKVHRSKLDTKVCVTAQHRQMLDDVLKVFSIRPEYDLNIMEEGQSLERVTQKIIDRISPILRKEQPDLALVHGDTSTTFLTTLACFHQKIPVGHVEAGLRSYNFDHPFPEEANRKLTDTLCTLHFAPTPNAKKNLLKENIPNERIFVTGNSVIDALQFALSRPHRFGDQKLCDLFDFPPTPPTPPSTSLSPSSNLSSLILVTAHRRENFGKPLENICLALKSIADSFTDTQIIYPVHLNPNVQSIVKKILAGHPRIILLSPLNYLDFCHLMKRCHLIVTDSGGLQEEAPSLGKPLLVLRKITERPEALSNGTAKVVGLEKEKIVKEISKLMTDSHHYKRMATPSNLYGDGRASQRIVDVILHYFGYKKKPKNFKPCN